MGSVKDMVVIKEPEVEKPGIGRFIFSDRYSVFDWGEMPDLIEGKGEAICISTAHFFEKLEKMGIKTHYLGLIEDGNLKKLNELKKPTNVMQFKLLRVVKPELKSGEYNYSVYETMKGNFLIPLEIIYRNSLPEGSSVFRRLKEGKLRPEDMGLDRVPEPGYKFEIPMVDVSTKLEQKDRYINWEEAKRIAGLSEDEVEKIKEITLEIDRIITEETKRLNLFNEDGKVEFGFDNKRSLLLVDAVGTLDECRFTFNGIPVSKEIARIFYRNTDWYIEVKEVKKKSKINWKEHVKKSPPPLPQELKETISMIYKAYANELTEKEWFDVPPLSKLLKELKRFIT